MKTKLLPIRHDSGSVTGNFSNFYLTFSKQSVIIFDAYIKTIIIITITKP